MPYLFTSESVSEGHPDKIADRISDALLDNFLAFDQESKVACETLVTTGLVVLAGEVKTKSYLDVQTIARQTINNIGYTKGEYQFSGDSCGVISLIHEQSPEINQGVDRAQKEEQGAGDQGMMFGYATDETEEYMPLASIIARKLVQTLSEIRKEGAQMTYLRPDAKSQVTIEYDDNDIPIRITTIVLSTQHDDFDKDDAMLLKIRKDILNILIPKIKSSFSTDISSLFDNNIEYYINPTGKFVIGGPHGDTGLTGRKIIIDTYGGKGAHGGGAFSGKDPSKVDRSAAYAARHIAKNLVVAGVSKEILIQVSYAIGVAEPVSVFVNTYGKKRVSLTDEEISRKIFKTFDLRPSAIEKRLKLRHPIYEETSSYGHMGHTPSILQKKFVSPYNGPVTLEVELFTWEKLDYVDIIKKEFGL